MFSFFRPKGELCALFEVGSSSVGAALARMTPGEGMEILYTLREGMPLRARVEPKRLMADLSAALKRANERLAKEALAQAKLGSKDAEIRHVAYSLSSPWSATRSKSASIVRKESFELTSALVAKAVDLEEGAFEKELGGDLAVLEKRVVDVSLDGKPASDPYGKQAKRADISLFMTLAPKAVLDRMFGASMTAHSPKNTRAFSFPLAAFSAVRDAMGERRDGFIVLDVGGEVTDLVVAKEGHVLAAASIPFGRNQLIRKAAQALDIGLAEAESMLCLCLDGRASADAESKLKGVLEAAADEYSKALREALAKISGQTAVPRDVLSLAEGDFSRFFSQAAKKDATLSVSSFGADALKPVVRFAPRAKRDVSLAIVAAFATRTAGLDDGRS